MSGNLACTGDIARQDLAHFFSDNLPFNEYLPGKKIALSPALPSEAWAVILEKLGTRTVSINRLNEAEAEVCFAELSPEAQISVVITSYEPRLEKLERCIRHVVKAAAPINQKGGCVEILIVDDGSADTEPSVSLVDLLRGELQHPALSLKFLPLGKNKGVSNARNVGISKANFDWVVILDYDDYISLSHLAEYSIDLAAGADVVASDMLFPDGHIFCSRRPMSAGELYKENCFGSGIAINTRSAIIQGLIKTGGVYNAENIHHFEDWELNTVLAMLGAKIAIVPVATYFYDFSPSGRDSTNVEMKYASSLSTPINAAKRAECIDSKAAFAELETYSRKLVSELATVHAFTGGMISGSHFSMIARLIFALRQKLKRIDAAAGQAKFVGKFYCILRPYLRWLNKVI